MPRRTNPTRVPSQQVSHGQHTARANYPSRFSPPASRHNRQTTTHADIGMSYSPSSRSSFSSSSSSSSEEGARRFHPDDANTRSSFSSSSLSSFEGGDRRFHPDDANTRSSFSSSSSSSSEEGDRDFGPNHGYPFDSYNHEPPGPRRVGFLLRILFSQDCRLLKLY